MADYKEQADLSMGQNHADTRVMRKGWSRREFVFWALATSLASWPARIVFGRELHNEIPYRVLGKTGEKVSCVGLGGYHIGLPTEAEGIRIIRSALDNGINFMDNCWDYNGGNSEIRMGKALRDGYRERAFLMSKIDGRDKRTAARQIDESLRRLQTDRIDLMQIHEVIRLTDPDKCFSADGAIHALIEAKKAGKIRYIGFTGHKSPDIHLQMLEVAQKHEFHFDAVQMPLNVMDAHFESFERKVLPVLVSQEIAVLGMKPIGCGIILQSNTVPAVDCLRYALSLPTSVVITGCDSMAILEQALRVARNFKPLSPDERLALLQRTAPLAANGKFELYKSSVHFDGTAKHPEWLG